MTREETLKILMGMQVQYPNFNPKDKRYTLDLWHKAFEDQNYLEISDALMYFFKNDTKGFAPLPGQLLDCARKLRNKKRIREIEKILLTTPVRDELDDKQSDKMIEAK